MTTDGNSEDGVTLIELMIVIFILAFIAMITVQGFQSELSGSTVLKQVQSAKYSLQFARSQAMITGTPVSVKSTDCALSFSYIGTPPKNAAALPVTTGDAQMTCTPGFSLIFEPNGMLTNNKQMPTGENWEITSTSGHSSELQLHAGGAIDLPN